MNKIAFTTSLILCLLGISLAKAEASDFIIPANAYSISSNAGAFNDIADNPATKKFGADLTAGTPLKDGFFINDEATPFVTHTADRQKTDPGFPLGFDFNFCGKTMKYFTVCASGGIFFGADENIIQGQSQSWHAAWDWAANLQNILSLITKDQNGQLNTAESIAGKSPVMYLTEGTTGEQVLTVQYDYAINGNEWVYQIKAYEASGNVELVVKKLETKANDTTRLFFGLVENGNYSIADDVFVTMQIQNESKHFLGMTQAEASGWNTVTAYTGINQAPDGLFVTNANTPSEGWTLAFNAPTDCAEKAKKFEDAWYGFSTTNITKTAFSGQFSFNKNNMTVQDMTEAGTLVAVLSTSQTPDYTLSNGTYYRVGDKPSDNSRVLLNTKGGYVQLNTIQTTNSKYMTVSASGLTEATTYYIHIYAMDYRCTGAPAYSDLCRTFEVTTSIDLPLTLSAGLPTPRSVPVTVQAANNLGVVLLKSPNTKALKLSGQLKAGDQIDDAEVLTVISSSDRTDFDVPFEAAGQGAYILAYSVRNPEGTNPVYGADFLNTPVRAAYEGLPLTFEFQNESYTVPQSPSVYGQLPFGWTRETEFPTGSRSSAFRLGTLSEDDNTVCLRATYPGTSDNPWTGWVDVATPAFVLPAGKTQISATFFISYKQNQSQGEPTTYKPSGNDFVRIEYSVDGGEWVEALNIDCLNDDFPRINTAGQYPLSVSLNGLSSGNTIRLRYSFQTSISGNNGSIINFIHSVAITEGKECEQPRSEQSIDSLSTTDMLFFSWLDNNLPAAATSLLSYREAEGNDTWHYVRVSTPAGTNATTPIEGSLSGLKAGTAYQVRIAALCSRYDTSFYTEPMQVRTAYELPYDESMAKTGSGASAQTPFDRGVKTYSGRIGGNLTETTDAQTGWNQNVTSDPYGRTNTVSVGDFVSGAWLMLPAIYAQANGDFLPKSLTFTLSGFDGDKHKGAKPNYTDTELRVLVSGNGLFTEQNIVKTLNADSLACSDRVFTVDLTQWEGFVQVAFVFECPSGVQSATAGNDDDTEDRPDPWYLEISQVNMQYDVDVCFPIKTLTHSLGSYEVSLKWEASTSAVEYGIFWKPYAETEYKPENAAYTKATNYTITGLQDQTRYNAMVIAYCNEDRTLAAEPVTDIFRTMIGCHTPEDFHVEGITTNGADFISTHDQPDFLSYRIIYITPDKGGNTLTLKQESDKLSIRDTLNEKTAYTVTTQAVCEDILSPMSEAIHFTTLGDKDDTSAVENLAQLKGMFNVRAHDGQVTIQNPDGLLIRNVSIHNLSGAKLADFRLDSRDDLMLPVNARHLLVFVRLQTERGSVVYKVYLP